MLNQKRINDQTGMDGPCITLEWAHDGLLHALARRDIVVIVDTLRFSSAVVTAVAHGFIILPVPDRTQGEELSRTTNARLAVRSGQPGISISPVSFIAAPLHAMKKIILPSPNGAACAARVKNTDTAFIGCFLNARAVGELVSSMAKAQQRNVTIISCGEQCSVVSGQRIMDLPEQGHRVFAIEDYLGAGAIMAHTALHRSREAEVCCRSFARSQNNVLGSLRDSFSGRYLIEKRMTRDIEHAARLDLYSVVPTVHGGHPVTIS